MPALPCCAVPSVPMANCPTTASPSQSHRTQPHTQLSPAPENMELPDLTSWRNGKDGERCLPYLRGQIASSCGQIKSDGDRLEEGIFFPCKANSLSPFPVYSGSGWAAFCSGNLLCCRGKSKRMDDVRAGT